MKKRPALAKAAGIAAAFLLFNQACATGINNDTKAFTPVAEMSLQDWNDTEELQRVWQAALVRIPEDKGRYLAATMATLNEQNISQAAKYPTVIYLHGCTGIWEGTYTRIDLLAKNGYAVIAPISFARKKYPKSCEPKDRRAGFYRGTLRMRQYDVGYAIEKARALPWVDSGNVFLMGFSQGGIVTATLASTSEHTSLRARIVEGWTCHAGWSEYKGVNAPESEPVLTLVGVNDPWFQSPWTRGACSVWLDRDNGSMSIVYTDDPSDHRHESMERRGVQKKVSDEYLSHQHSLLESTKVQTAVLQFLRTHTK